MRPNLLSLRTRLFVSSLVLLVLASFAARAYVMPRVESLLMLRFEQDLMRTAVLIAAQAADVAASADLAVWDALADGTAHSSGVHVTLIAANGRVLGDSDHDVSRIATMGSAAGQREVNEALRDGRGTSTRWSDPAGAPLVHAAAAWGAPVAGVARTAIPLAEVNAALAESERTLAIGHLLGLSLAGLLAYLVARWMTKPVEELVRVSDEVDAGASQTRGRAGGGDEVRRVARVLGAVAADRTRVSETLVRERDLLAVILEGMREGILLIDRDRRIVMANAMLRELFVAGPDVVGRTTLESFRCPPLEQAIGQAAQTSTESRCEVEVAGLRPRVLQTSIAPISSAPDSLLLAVFHDVTELRRLETVRRDFVASASHELRTPVAAIRGAAEALEEPGVAPSDDARAFAGIVRRHAEQLTQLVGDLLDLSRIESGALALVPTEVDVCGEIRAAAEDFEEIARARSIRFDVEAVGVVAPVFVDRNALRQVLHNLVDNACKYSEEGAVVTLRAESGGDKAIVTINDTGPGIEERHLSRLFERFYRVDVARSRALGGTGLGLSIVKHLVESMGGEVSVTSAVGRGSVFRFTVPYAAARA